MRKQKIVVFVAALALMFGLLRLPWIGIIQIVTGIAGRHAEAFELARKSCELGDSMGCGGLGGAYQSGSGVELDLAKAAELFRKAAVLYHKPEKNRTYAKLESIIDPN